MRIIIYNSDLLINYIITVISFYSKLTNQWFIEHYLIFVTENSNTNSELNKCNHS